MILGWIILTLAVLVAAYIVPGVRVSSFGGALGAAAVLGLLNLLVKPVLVVLTLPLTFLTLGLFLLVINALVLLLAGAVAPGWIRVRGFGPALLASLIISLVGALMRGVIG